MRYRDYRDSGAGTCFHIFNRGNGRMDIFRDNQDYDNFLKRLRIILGREESLQGASLRPSLRLTPFEKDAFSLISFCLMPNHFHLQVMQNTDIPVGKLLAKVCTSYSMYFNRKHNHVGHVFQDQFKAVPIQNDGQFVAVSAYIHQNPKVAGLVSDLRDWQHSSYPSYLGIREDTVCDRRAVMAQFKDAIEYQEFVENRYEEIKERKEIVELMLDQ